jgi:hypothetical protein
VVDGSLPGFGLVYILRVLGHCMHYCPPCRHDGDATLSSCIRALCMHVMANLLVIPERKKKSDPVTVRLDDGARKRQYRDRLTGNLTSRSVYLQRIILFNLLALTHDTRTYTSEGSRRTRTPRMASANARGSATTVLRWMAR